MMPKINRDAYNNTTYGSGFKPFCAGAYVGRIQAVRTSWEEMDWDAGRRTQRTAESEQAVMFVFDIAEGEFEGEFSRDFYMKNGSVDPDKDFLHWVRYSWALDPKTGEYKDLVRFDDALKASNPGFDPEPAFDADRWELYVGKLFGFVADGTVRTNDQGYDTWRTNVKPWKVCSADDIREGKHAEPRITDKRTKVAEPITLTPDDGYFAGGSTVSAGAYDDIPFM